MTKEESALLLYLETRAVDYGGRVAAEKMNEDDFTIAKRWKAEGFIDFGRIKVRDHNSQGTHWVSLSESAWAAAHAERRNRAARMWANRMYEGVGLASV